MIMPRSLLFRVGYALAVILLAAAAASAQTDEIQVYDGGLAEPGVFNLTLHNNFVASGITDPAFPGAVAANRSFNGVPEWAVGVTRWLELGLYLPVYSRDQRNGWGIDGFKPRALFAVPDADNRRFVYGVNFEFSINAHRWDTKRYTSEIRPIVGWHLQSVDVVFNPILDTSYDGVKNLDFAPSTRIAYKKSPRLALAVEEYADYGPLRGFYGGRDQGHQLFGVVDYGFAHGIDMEAGIGAGLTDATDGLTFKLILSRDLNAGHHGAR
jgi:hypothetical protein